MPKESKRPLKVFLCHASQDKPAVRELYWRLVHDGVDVWLDETNLLPGMDWQLEIPKAVRSSDVIIICLSDHSVTKEGYVQKEIRFALDVADEKPDGTIFLIPVRLNACEIPSRLARWQWVDLFSSDGYRKLRISLRVRADSIGAALYSAKTKPEVAPVPPQGSQYPVDAPSGNKHGVASDVIGRLLVFTLFVLTCAGIYWAGKWLVTAVSQTPVPTVTPSASTTPEVPTQPPTDIPAPVPPGLPTATFFVPFVINTIPPTPMALPTLTLMPSATAFPTFTSTATAFPEPPMVLIPGGSFLMGRNGGPGDEAPPHTVLVDSFYMDRFEVTNEWYHFCDLSGVCQYPPKTSDIPKDYYGLNYFNYPVVNVSWEMAKKYCEWRGARLPTEAEWEKAARGGLTGMLYPWGNDAPICDADAKRGANFAGCSEKGTVKIQSFSHNGYGLYDMVGNVWEWVSDWYAPDYYRQNDARNPQGPPAGERKVLRGGSWTDIGTNISVVNRGSAPPSTQDRNIGFRCARDAAP